MPSLPAADRDEIEKQIKRYSHRKEKISTSIEKSANHSLDSRSYRDVKVNICHSATSDLSGQALSALELLLIVN
jgi:hypothetical protein